MAATHGTCRDCGGRTGDARSTRCERCYATARSSASRASLRKCSSCGAALSKQAKRNTCALCLAGRISATATETATVAPAIAPTPNYATDAVVCGDIHAPWHDPAAIRTLCEWALAFGVKTLIVGGDLVHFDSISKYVGLARTVPVPTELRACRRLLDALELVFDRIIVIPGNHDQRLDKMIAKMGDTAQGRKAMELVADLLGADKDDVADVTGKTLAHYLSSPKVTIHELPDLTLNGKWLVQHPGTVSRLPARNEQFMVEKFRMSVVQGHSHLFGVSFDRSGEDVAFNCGHLSDDSKFRYVREKPSTFPRMVQGFGLILGDRLIPVALHDRWMNLDTLRRMVATA